jgi:hypothetical protein
VRILSPLLARLSAAEATESVNVPVRKPCAVPRFELRSARKVGDVLPLQPNVVLQQL